MSAPAKVTEAHRKLAQSIKLRWCSYDDAAQLIADSEARARCEIAMVAAESADRNVSLRLQNAQLRAVFPKILAALGNGACCAPDVSVEFIKAIPNEVAEVVAQLRDDAQRLKADGAATAFVNMSCRASRAETDRNNLRADLDAIKAILNEEKDRAERAEAELAFQVARNSDLFTQRDGAVEAQEKAEAELDAERAKAADQGLTLASLCDGILGEDHADRSDQTLIRIGCGMKKELAASRYETVKAAQEGLRECIRAERAEAELAAERARLDWLEQKKPILWALEDYASAPYWLLTDFPGYTEETASQHKTARAAIDAAMKEETK